MHVALPIAGREGECKSPQPTSAGQSDIPCLAQKQTNGLMNVSK